MNTLNPHALEASQVIEHFNTPKGGLGADECKKRLEDFGPNILPTAPPPTLLKIFLHQFLNPLVYILGIAAAISLSLGDYSDALFIGLVLFLNAIIGTIQEHSAEKSAQALKKMAATKCVVEREGELFEIDAEELVPGDFVILESGNKIPADIRLVSSHHLEIDESLLTGESLAVVKDHSSVLDAEATLADRNNMLFTGALVAKGRAKGIVVATGLSTELGKIAESITFGKEAKPPLLLRMEKFTKSVTFFLGLMTLLMGAVLFFKGQTWYEVLMFSVALSVSAIPEGLPVALTIALSIASHKMSKKNVIVRKLPAVEALGSCSYIATDKTGTLTVNQLTVKKICIASVTTFDLEGSGLNPEGNVISSVSLDDAIKKSLLEKIIEPSVLCNEAHLTHKNNTWTGHGDAVDLAFQVAAYKSGFLPSEIINHHELVDEVPFEPENQYAATVHKSEDTLIVSVKGAVEKILVFCSKMQHQNGEEAIDTELIISKAEEMAKSGYRVLGVAQKSVRERDANKDDLYSELTFSGMVGMIDPLRPEAADAIQSCRDAGIEVAMVTGDHPLTALAISRELNLADDIKQVVTGPQLKQASEEERGELIKAARVFARVEPQQKLEIVNNLVSQGQYVAVTGDGANDAPALKSSNVGVAMGKSGTDIAKETSDLIITDDRFASIVAGVIEGRVAYSNVRKVVYLLIATGAGEIVLFFLAVIFNTALPLTAVQLLWLNLVTNGIQDVGLACESGEGDELTRPPRKPSEPVFDRLMLERIIISAITVGVVSFIFFYYQMQSGQDIDSARNLTLLLLVLFENVMIGNSKSEDKTFFKCNILDNKILLFGTILAQLVHIAAMYIPGLQKVLGVSPIRLIDWLELLGLALSVFVVIEIYKKFRSVFPLKRS